MRRRLFGKVYRRRLGPLAAVCLLSGLAVPVGGSAVAAAPAQARATSFLHCGNNIFPSPKSKNAFSPNIPYQVHNFMLLPLAYQNPHGLTSFIPEVATSWVSGNHRLTVHLRRHILWQDGTPLTSTDVVTSADLGAVDPSGLWNAISAVRATGPHTVVFSLAKKAGIAPAEALILGMTVVPTEQYGRFVSQQLAKAIPAYEASVRSNPTGAASSPTASKMTAALSALEKFSPTTLIGDGPYRLTSWTQSQALFSKSRTFFAAKNVHVDRFIVQDTDQTVDEGAIISGQCDQSLSGMPETIYQKDAQLPGHKVYYPLTYSQKYLEFNSRHYPINMTKVRQALAYIVHRRVLIPLTYGVNMTYRFSPKPSLLYYGNEHQFVTKSQLASLNSYSYDPGKATKILDSLGFKKTKGVWHLPNGKPFTLSILVQSVFPNYITNGKYISEWLTSFGIKTTEQDASATAVANAFNNGSFELEEGAYFGGINPLQAMDQTFGPGRNFISKTEPGLGFGPTENVPGLGKVNVSTEIQKDAATLSYGPKMKKVVWDWARFVNQQLPVLGYGDRRFGVMISTLHYMWPARSSPLWTLTAFNNYGGLVVMLERGLLRPKQ